MYQNVCCVWILKKSRFMGTFSTGSVPALGLASISIGIPASNPLPKASSISIIGPPPLTVTPGVLSTSNLVETTQPGL